MDLLRCTLGAPKFKKCRDQTWNSESAKQVAYHLNVVTQAKYHYLKFLLIRIFIWMFVLIKFLIFTFFRDDANSHSFSSRCTLGAPKVHLRCTYFCIILVQLRWTLGAPKVHLRCTYFKKVLIFWSRKKINFYKKYFFLRHLSL